MNISLITSIIISIMSFLPCDMLHLQSHMIEKQYVIEVNIVDSRFRMPGIHHY